MGEVHEHFNDPSESSRMTLMNTFRTRAAKLVAVALVLALSQAYANADLLKSAAAAGAARLGAPQAHQGRLTTRGDNPVTVGSASAKTGDTVFSGQQIQTPDKVGATVQLAPLGRVDVAPNTNLTLAFEDGKINVMLVSGCVILTANKGVTGTLQSGASSQQTDPAKGGTIDVCTSQTPGAAPIAGQGAAAAAGAGAGAAGGAAAGAATAAAATGGLFGLGAAGTVGFLAAAGTITAASVVAVNNRPNPSPVR
jgi:hypothetical protein